MKTMEIIQQWQFLGRVHPNLLKDEIFKKCKEHGITSLQSYVLWSEIEKEHGKFDFSFYDELVTKLKKHDLKWVPFIIFGPNYATPKWFHQSKDSVYAKCLEHKKESKIQSIWNPNLEKYVEIFLEKISEKYENSRILESISLGIGGNWGEALYPVTGGFYSNFHSHLGFWAADRYAKDDFIRFLLEKYQSLGRLNSFWGTNYSSKNDIDFPLLENKKSLFGFLVSLSGRLPSWLKDILKGALKIFKKNVFLTAEESSLPKENGKRWTDFMEWYLASMNKWVDLWISKARKLFPNQKIYLVTGGIGNPATGADLAKQVKVAAKHGAGIRITNQTNNYSQSFILTRLVSSACKLYNSYFVTEEAAVLQSPEGVLMRIFDAVSSGAKGIYCKNFISTGGDPVIKKFSPVGKITPGLKILKDNLHYFKGEKSIVKTAVLFPNLSIYSDPGLIIALYNKCSSLRDFVDFDLIDENMILDGGLMNYRYMLVLLGEIKGTETIEKVKEWEKGGGKMMNDPRLEDLEEFLDKEKDGVYAVLFENKTLYYNSNNSKKTKKAENRTFEINPNSIYELKT